MRRRLAWWPCSVKSVMVWRMAARFWPGLLGALSLGGVAWLWLGVSSLAFVLVWIVGYLRKA